ncbi:anti-virulence regulator CigR family protein [Pseudomonas gingeri]|uniref:RcnB family protein n=1 Tax=Pseudomonas gingeri TaxID=117681 RepID=A0A7Y8BU93_9PSED|nr:anti-virulence regulator CigR family protein [Pseudomonas gingeri]NWB88740.1 RcnB family protein [Pseudomonas gingeri]
MKMPKRLMAGLGLLVLSASPLLHAEDQWHGEDHDHGGYDQRGPDRGHDERNMHRPPQDFGPVRQIIHDDREHFGRGAPPPPGYRLERGRPLPRGYEGERLDDRALSRLPRYEGYEWRRIGNDVVLITIGTGVVYEILDGVLN